MPFQSNEKMLVDATERALKEEGEGDDENLMKINKKQPQTKAAPKQTEEVIPEYDDPLKDIFGTEDNNQDKSPVDGFDALGLFNDTPVQSAPQTASVSSPLDDIFGFGASSAPVSFEISLNNNFFSLNRPLLHRLQHQYQLHHSCLPCHPGQLTYSQ